MSPTRLDTDFSCRWHTRHWVACNYCAEHRRREIERCRPNDPCGICDQASLWDDEEGAVTVGQILLYFLAAVGLLIVVPFLILLALSVLGASAGAN